MALSTADKIVPCSRPLCEWKKRKKKKKINEMKSKLHKYGYYDANMMIVRTDVTVITEHTTFRIRRQFCTMR